MSFLVSTRARIINGFTLVVLIGCGLLVASAISRVAMPSHSGPPRPARLHTPNRLEMSQEEIEVEVVTVRESGFEPREITRPQGPFMLAIINKSGAAELALRLDTVQRNRVHEVRLPKGRIRWHQRLDLPTGDYVLSEQNHPDWICRLRLTAR